MFGMIVEDVEPHPESTAVPVATEPAAGSDMGWTAELNVNEDSRNSTAMSFGPTPLKFIKLILINVSFLKV